MAYADSKLPVGLELYSVRNTLAADLEGTLDKVKSYGYDAVEFAGKPQYDAARTLNALRASGLYCSSWHVPFDSLLGTDEAFEKTVEFHSAVGNKYLMIPWLPGDWLAGSGAIKRTGEKLNALSKRLAAYGLYTGYHNHSAEFAADPETGKTAWSMLREATCPEFVMQLDTGNAMNGGADVNGELLKAVGRSQIIHLKPYSLTKKFATMIGDADDATDYETILRFCKNEGKTHICVIEYECTELYSDLEGVRLCVERLRGKFGGLL